MAENTVTRADLSEAVYQEVGLSRNESADLVEHVLSEISETLVRGEAVKISSFGSFAVRQKGQRIGRNPKTGEEVPILPRKVLVFRASNVLKNQINNIGSGGGGFEKATALNPGSDTSSSQERSGPEFSGSTLGTRSSFNSHRS